MRRITSSTARPKNKPHTKACCGLPRNKWSLQRRQERSAGGHPERRWRCLHGKPAVRAGPQQSPVESSLQIECNVELSPVRLRSDRPFRLPGEHFLALNCQAQSLHSSGLLSCPPIICELQRLQWRPLAPTSSQLRQFLCPISPGKRDRLQCIWIHKRDSAKQKGVRNHTFATGIGHRAARDR